MSAENSDLSSIINARFDDTNKRIENIQNSLNGLENKDHAASETAYLTYRISTVENEVTKTKATIWRTVCTVSGVVAFIVTLAVSIIALVV